ncbi:MAG: YeeE/YedE family protein [Myxococcota bacterium]
MFISSLIAVFAGPTIPTLAAGALFGLGAGLLLVGGGRIAGISGILAGALRGRRGDIAWRVSFVFGLLLGGQLAFRIVPHAIAVQSPRALPWVAFSGVCIGLGARLANGCTSGHGICGIGRLSLRSLIAVATFTLAGATARLVWTTFGGLS